MQIIYIDELILLNFITDAVLLKFTSTLCGEKLTYKRTIFAVFFGAAYAAFSVFYPFMSCFIAKAAAGTAMIFIAFGKRKITGKTVFFFFASAFLFGGAVSAFEGGAGISGIAAVIVIAIAYRLFSRLFEKMLTSPHLDDGLIKSAEITSPNGKKLATRLYADTGNMLRDPYTRKHCVVMPLDKAEKLFGERDRAFIEKTKEKGIYEAILETEFSDEDIKFIPVRYTVIGGGGVMPAFSPKKITVCGIERSDILIAVHIGKTDLQPGCGGIIGVI